LLFGRAQLRKSLLSTLESRIQIQKYYGDYGLMLKTLRRPGLFSEEEGGIGKNIIETSKRCKMPRHKNIMVNGLNAHSA